MIEIAKQQDLPRIKELVKMGLMELDIEHLPEIDDSVLEDTIYKNWLVVPTFIVKRNKKIIGCACLSLSTFGWSKEIHLDTFMVYILPEYRNYAILNNLYKKIKNFAKLQGLLYVDVYLGKDKIDERRRLIRSNGLTEIGIFVAYKGT